MTIVKNPAGWTYDTATRLLSWPDDSRDGVEMPDVSLASAVYFGFNYLSSQAASRTVGDAFRKEWAEDADGRKAKDAPKDVVPASDSARYVAKLLEVRRDLFDKLVAGYEVGDRAGAADPLAEAVDDAAREWLQGVATTYGWYTLPAKKKVARDGDAYTDPKGRYATFGEALAAFKSSEASVTAKLVGKDQHGKPWPFRIAKGATVAAAIAAEAQRRVDEAKPKVSVALGGEGDAAEVDF